MYEKNNNLNTNNGEIMKKLIIILTLTFSIITYKIINITSNKEYYTKLLKNKTTLLVSGPTAKRGRILDTNGKIIVDNEKVNTIFFHNNKNLTKDQKKNIVSVLSQYAPESIIEKEKYIEDLLKKGYSYEDKIILKNLSDEDYAKIIELNLPGIYGGYTWKRKYLYPDLLKSILGTVGSIPANKKEEYLKKGYNLNDTVGLSYLEYQYDDYLKGSNAIYEVNQKDNSLILIKEEEPGNDVVLSIDLEKQLKLEEILKENIQKAKKEANTNYYKESYAIISDPKTGNIIAISGKRYLADSKFEDVTNNIIKTSYVMGSVVKGATISVGYKYNIINIGTKMKDSCIKLSNVPQKCSFKNLGTINDLEALENSSNYYQFKIAIGLTNNVYKPNIKLNATINHFNMYRDILKEYGLGVKTNIDLPGEETGIQGSKIADDLLLNLAIGQYDTYTPIELMQYINTLANKGTKTTPSLMKEIKKENLTIHQNKKDTNKISIEDKYINRINEGLNKVLISGTGRGYVDKSLNPAGKTGTSESFYDSNNDGLVDTLTTTKTFAGYIPYENPQYSLIVISPNISYENDKFTYTSGVNRRITRSITNFLFDI